MPVIVRELDDNSAAIIMVDSNLEQRDKLLYSEKAWAYRVKLEALNHNGIKGEMLSVDVLVEQTGESKNQIFRLIRLTELVVTLLDRVDAKQLAFNPAVELSYLTQKEQSAVASVMDKYEVKPSLSQAQRLKKLAQAGALTLEKIDALLSEVKKPPRSEQSGLTRFRQFFPPDYSQKQMEDVILKLLKKWDKGVGA
jgi:ParB family chromosome partitioning protein